jgi:hypothetical protein
MGGGELITRGTPDEMIGRVEGKLYRKTTNKAEAREIKKNMQMTSARLRKQEVIVSIISQGDPGNGFEPVKPLLEDAYFAHLYKFV